MRRQFLGNLGGHARGDFRVEHLAKIAQDLRRSNDDKLVGKTGLSMAIERISKLAGKPLLGEIVPVGFFHGTSGNTNTCAGPPRTIGTLLARRRIVAFKNLLNNELNTL